MNAFNRFFVIITLVVLLVAGVVTLVSPAFTLGLLQNTANNFHNSFAGYSDLSRIATRITFAIGWAMLIGLLLWMQLRRSSSRTIEVARYTGGNAIRISTGAVAEKVQDAVNAIGGVIDAKVKATGRDRAVEIKLDVTATKSTDLVSKAEEIAITTRQVVQDQLGLKLSGKPQVAIRAKEGKPAKTKPVKQNVSPLIEATPPAETIAPALPEAGSTNTASTQSTAPQP